MITASSIRVQRTSTILRPDQSRVLLRPFRHEDPERSRRIIARIMSLPEKQVGPLLNEVSAEFSQRHQQIHRSFLERFEQVRDLVMTDEGISEQRQLLIGSYFVCEYSLESAALFNPSIVPHPDQADMPPALCVSSSACAPQGRGIFPPSLFAPASSTPIIGSKSYPQQASLPSHVRFRTLVTKRRFLSESFLSCD